LKFVTFEENSSLTTIEQGSFADCINLLDVQIPSSVLVIGEGAFSGCQSLVNIDIPNSVTNIEPGAFLNCENLTTIHIPNSVTNIGVYAFDMCPVLKIFVDAKELPDTWHTEWNITSPVYWAGSWHYNQDGKPVPN